MVLKTENTMKQLNILYILIFITAFLVNDVTGQSFGRNKMRYRNFDFKVKETEHFEIYYYLKNEKVIDELGQYIEQWYDIFSV